MNPKDRKEMTELRRLLKEIWLIPTFNREAEAQILTKMDLLIRKNMDGIKNMKDIAKEI